MPFLSSWSTFDKRVLLHFSHSVLETFVRCRQAKSSDAESGGILLGTVHGSNLLITETTTPTRLDIRRRCFFERLPFGHISIAKSAGRPVGAPSGIRVSGMLIQRSIPARRNWIKVNGRPVLAVIVGHYALHIELITSTATTSVSSTLNVLFLVCFALDRCICKIRLPLLAGFADTPLQNNHALTTRALTSSSCARAVLSFAWKSCASLRAAPNLLIRRALSLLSCVR